jgi:hypothetical protein
MTERQPYRYLAKVAIAKESFLATMALHRRETQQVRYRLSLEFGQQASITFTKRRAC